MRAVTLFLAMISPGLMRDVMLAQRNLTMFYFGSGRPEYFLAISAALTLPAGAWLPDDVLL
jgi:hypothetical protein